MYDDLDIDEFDESEPVDWKAFDLRVALRRCLKGALSALVVGLMAAGQAGVFDFRSLGLSVLAGLLGGLVADHDAFVRG